MVRQIGWNKKNGELEEQTFKFVCIDHARMVAALFNVDEIIHAFGGCGGVHTWEYTTIRMSDSRQRHTGKLLENLLFWGGVFFLLWFLPDVIFRLYPRLGIETTQPWLLEPSDLDARRIAVNLITKPGFRMVVFAAFVLVLCVVKMIVAGLTHYDVQGRLESKTTEWVVDGEKSSLMEYGRWVGVVGR